MKNTSSRRILKAKARKILSGQYVLPVALTLLLTFLNLGANLLLNALFSSVGGMLNLILQLASAAIINILYYLLLAGQARIYLGLSAGRQFRFQELTYAFTAHPEPIAIYAIVQYALQTIFLNSVLRLISDLFSGSFLPEMAAIALVCMIVFVWIQLGFAPVLYLYNDHPDLSVKTLLLQSLHMMKGNRIRLFLIYLSFLGLDLLCVLSFGIGYLFVEPYRQTTIALFYKELAASTRGL